jgi:hypothetical protein
MLNDHLKKQGKNGKQLLPPWTKNLGAFQPYRETSFSSRMGRPRKEGHNPAPQQLTMAQTPML